MGFPAGAFIGKKICEKEDTEMNLGTAKFEDPLQLGGIRTGPLDSPGAGGGCATRVALFATTKRCSTPRRTNHTAIVTFRLGQMCAEKFNM